MLCYWLAAEVQKSTSHRCVVVAIYEGKWTQICHQTTSQHHVLQCFNNPRQKNHNSTKYSHIRCTGWGSTGESPIRCICLHAWWPVWHQISWLSTVCCCLAQPVVHCCALLVTSMLLTKRSITVSFGSGIFCSSDPTFWNSLPNPLRQPSVSLDCFKKRPHVSGMTLCWPFSTHYGELLYVFMSLLLMWIDEIN